MSTERTNKRDRHYSERHHKYGPLSMIDLDSVEYDGNVPVGLIEAKHSHVQEIDLSSSELKKLYNLAAICNLPLFVTVYWFFSERVVLDANDFGKLPITHVQYYVAPINQRAKEFLPEDRNMTEQEYVNLLYSLRGKQPPKDLTLYQTWRPCSPAPPIVGHCY